MSRLVRSSTAALAVLAVAASFPSQAEEPTVQNRIEVGQAAPDFTLPDPDGVEHDTSALRGEKNLLLVFFRGTW